RLRSKSNWVVFAGSWKKPSRIWLPPRLPWRSWEKRTRSWSNYPRARTKRGPTSADERLRRPHQGRGDHPQGGSAHRHPALECDEEAGPAHLLRAAGRTGGGQQTIPG